MKNRFLLGCGILAAVLYIAMNIFIPAKFSGYEMMSQTISELSAWSAPTRGVWIWMAAVYVLLLALFGWGIVRTAGGNWLLHIVGYLIFFYAVVNIYWPPMHMRGVEPSFSDSLHIIWASVTILLIMLIMIFAMAAVAGLFRTYTIVTILIFIIFGILTFIESPAIPRNQPTPYIGLWERINVGAFMAWLIAFSAILLRMERKQPRIIAVEQAVVGESRWSGYE